MALGPFNRACGSVGARAVKNRPQTTRPGSEGRWPGLMAPEAEAEAEGETANRIPSQPPSRTEPSGCSSVADAATPVRVIFRSPVVTRSAYI